MRLLTSMIVLSGAVMMSAGCNRPASQPANSPGPGPTAKAPAPAPAAAGEVVLNVPGMH